MVIVYNCDERFAGVFATAVVSLFESNKAADEITVYLIENNVSPESKAKFQQIAGAYGRTIITLPMPDLDRLAGVEVVIPGYNRMATCGRLFIASLLPESIDKVIYADSDTIFVESIDELWNMDISEYAVGMVDGAHNPSSRRQLDLPDDGLYYNSGLLLVNLKYWRDNHVEQRFLEFIRSQGGYVPFPDEGVLNAVFDGQIMDLPLRFNALTIIYALSYKELCYVRGIKAFYTPEEVQAAKEHPVMVHFTNNFYMPIRPWVKNSDHPYTEKYLSYRRKTPWRDDPLWEDTRSTIRKIYTRVCYTLPRPVAMWTARFITLYLTPLSNKYKKRKCKKLYCNRGGKFLTKNGDNLFDITVPALCAVSRREAA